jgi:hypothetical protein
LGLSVQHQHALSYSHGHHAASVGVYGRRGVGRAGQQVLPVAPQTTHRPARATAQRVSVGSDGLRPASDDGWAWPNQRRSRPNAGGQPSYGRRASRAPRRCLARAVDAGACHRPRSVTLVKSSVTLLGPGPLAPIQPPCLPLKRAVGTQTLAHPHPALIHASISVIERFARAYLQAAALSRWLRRSSPWRPFVCAWLRWISRVGQ